MIKVVGIWERGYNTPLSEYPLWRFPLNDFAVDEFIMTPVSGILGKVTEYKTVDEALVANASLTPVFFDERATTGLQEFEHPVDAIYVFGRANYSAWSSSVAALSVRIETPNPGGRLWPHQAAAIALYDRMAKS